MKAKNLDMLGMGTAIVCLIHCLFLPVLLAIPLGKWHNAYLDLVFLLIGALVVFRVTKVVEYPWLRYLFWAAIVLIGLSISLDLIFDVHSPLIYFGAVLLWSNPLFPGHGFYKLVQVNILRIIYFYSIFLVMRGHLQA